MFDSVCCLFSCFLVFMNLFMTTWLLTCNWISRTLFSVAHYNLVVSFISFVLQKYFLLLELDQIAINLPNPIFSFLPTMCVHLIRVPTTAKPNKTRDVFLNNKTFKSQCKFRTFTLIFSTFYDWSSVFRDLLRSRLDNLHNLSQNENIYVGAKFHAFIFAVGISMAKFLNRFSAY